MLRELAQSTRLTPPCRRPPLADEVGEPRALPIPELVARYEAGFGRTPRVRHREYLWKRVAWKLQEQRLGGLSSVAKQRLESMIAEIDIPIVERVRAVGTDPGVVEAALTAPHAEQMAREPELRAAVREQEEKAKRLGEEAANLTHSIGRGATVLGARLGEVDLALQAANRRASSARSELLALESRVLDAAALRKLMADFGPVWGGAVPEGTRTRAAAPDCSRPVRRAHQ